ncbi:MAG: type II toxin-antitoxin system VapC family toxin [Nocardioidaceae bacterium]
MIVVDTTVLVYAVGSEHEYREPCRSLVRALQSGELRATTTVEVIQEFAHVRARRRGRADARRLAVAYADLFSPLLTVTEAHLRRGLDLWSTRRRLGAFDAVLAAVAHQNEAEALVSSDQAFGRLPDVRHVVPDARGVARVLH